MNEHNNFDERSGTLQAEPTRWKARTDHWNALETQRHPKVLLLIPWTEELKSTC